MKSVESTLFNVSFVYNKDLAQKLIVIMKKKSSSERRRSSIRYLLFKMMKDIVKKNIQNYQNLLRSIEDLQREDIPVTDDLIGDCWEVFHICTEKYDPEKGDNFYFFYNKALSRKFYRDYQDKLKEMFREPRLDDECDFENRMSMSSLGGVETVDLIIDVLGFTDVEKRIALSKLRQQRTQDFLKENKDISSVTYSRALASVKEKLSQAYDI